MREFMEHLAGVRDWVLDNSALKVGETLLDVGCGDGLIAFRRAGAREAPTAERVGCANSIAP